MRNAFARDENGNVKTKQPCQTPGCDWPVWHICLVGKPDTTTDILQKEKRGGKRPRTDTHQQALSDSLKESWTARRAAEEKKNKKRDKKIIDRYNEGGIGYIGVAKELGLSGHAVLKVLKKAEADGKVVMRRRGANVRHEINN